jgi:hypothetical protein
MGLKMVAKALAVVMVPFTMIAISLPAKADAEGKKALQALGYRNQINVCVYTAGRLPKDMKLETTTVWVKGNAASMGITSVQIGAGRKAKICYDKRAVVAYKNRVNREVDHYMNAYPEETDGDTGYSLQ